MAIDQTKTVLCVLILLVFSDNAAAADRSSDIWQIKPILEGRLRYEHARQPALDADALTSRLRAGFEAQHQEFSLLAEAEGTVALNSHYNAFPFPLPGKRQSRPDHLVVADPMSAELNRFQIQYNDGGNAFTLGRQRINLDDQRWVGSVGWRQNEQTFDALRGSSGFGGLTADVTYAISQRTIFGSDAGRRTALSGDFVFAGLSGKLGPVSGKLFAYLLDYEEEFFSANSSQTWGLAVNTAVPVGKRKVALRGSYARQSDYAANPFDYGADYWSLDAAMTVANFSLAGGFEMLGSDRGRSLQTPMATLHKFNGWADVFLTTPPDGLKDFHISASRKFDKVRALRNLNATLSFHRFKSDAGNTAYGREWNASVGFLLGRTALLAKLANYDARGFGVDTRKFWLQAEWALQP